MASGTVRKRTRLRHNGEVTVTWIVDYYDQHRKRHFRTFPTKGAADDWLADVRIEVRTGIHTPDAASITVKQAAALWLAGDGPKDTRSRGTLRVYEQYVRLYINELVGAKRLSRLTTPDVSAFTKVLLRRTSRRRARKVLSTLKLILATMQGDGYVAQNVATPIHIKAGDEAKSHGPLQIGVDVPSKADVAAMLRHATGRDRAQFVTLALSGLRAGEMRGLFWADVDFEARILRVRHGADWWGTLGRIKTEKGYRDIPMAPLLVNTLKEWKLACPPRAPGRPDLVFPGRNGKVGSHSAVVEAFNRVQRLAGVAAIDANGAEQLKYEPHMLRHFFASWGIERGFASKRLQEILGHASIQMTFDRYGHWLGDIADDHARLAEGEADLLGTRPVGESF